MERYHQLLILFFLGLVAACRCAGLVPVPCNASLSNFSCPATLYYVPKQPQSGEETGALFGVRRDAVRKTVDGFLISVRCGCPAEHKVYIRHTGYTVQKGDSWEVVSEKFGWLVEERQEKQLVPGVNVSVDVVCRCSEGLELVTYIIQAGDTLFTVSSRFGVDMAQIEKLNGIADPLHILPGDNIFIPATGLGHLILIGENDSNTKGESRRFIMVVTVIPVTAVILFTIALLIWIYCRRKGQDSTKPFLGGTKNSQMTSLFHACKMGSLLDCHSFYQGKTTSFKSAKTTIFPYYEVCDATCKFSSSQKVGQGSYGSVYRGRLRELEVAIKQMKNTKSKEFFAELNILCKVHHNNLIKLIGYSAGAESLFLVYEYAQNGALSDHLHNPTIKGHKPLSWSKRVQIALDAAKGLEYIHAHIKPLCVHRDVKTSNILLDSDFRAKIADFGLVKLLGHSPEIVAATSNLVGTFGYLAPEYVRDGCVTPKTDVYAYGVVLMELITGQPALSRSINGEDKSVEHRSVVDYVLSAFEGTSDPMQRLEEIVDPNLMHYNKDSLLQMALLSKDCVDDDWKQRPDMSLVILRLSKITQSMEQDEVKSVLPTV